jgi:hypothetical protein
MKRLALVLAAASFVVGATAGTAASAHRSTTVCVGQRAGCYASLQPAFDAAGDGDTIRVDPGTYAGGVALDKSVTIVGSGATRTIISGGGPVLTIGVFGAADADKLKVSISGVTITGGVATSAPTPDGPITFVAVGGGVYIPSGPGGTVGATVTINHSVITGNHASPTSALADTGNDECPGGDCPFAFAAGGGIADVGRLTLVDSIVSDNVAGGPVASDAAGGGIWTATNGGPGSLTVIDSWISGNRASVSAPNGLFGHGGGIEVQDGEALTVRNSTVSGNTASVSNSYPSGVDMAADSGGIHIGGFGSAVIENTRITGNTASADDPSGFPGANDAALGDGLSNSCDSPGACGQTLQLRNSVIRDNHTIINASSSDNGPSVGALEIDGQATVSKTLITDNTTTVTNSGSASAVGTFGAFDGGTSPIVVTDSVVRDNEVTVSSETGTATIEGAGITNAGSLELHDSQIADNAAHATGQDGFAQGGGIWNGQPFGPDGPTPLQLTLDNTHVTQNVLTGSAGVTLQGGGLYTLGFPVTLTSSIIADNVPDQCYGC